MAEAASSSESPRPVALCDHPLRYAQSGQQEETALFALSLVLFMYGERVCVGVRMGGKRNLEKAKREGREEREAGKRRERKREKGEQGANRKRERENGSKSLMCGKRECEKEQLCKEAGVHTTKAEESGLDSKTKREIEEGSEREGEMMRGASPQEGEPGAILLQQKQQQKRTL